MYLTKIYVENFGVLHDYEYVPKEGLNQIFMENGGGKTTLAVFLRAMFYGMPQTRTRKSLDDAERKKYMPWQGGKMGGYVCFDEGGRSYRLIRTFGSREKEDTFKLFDERTGMEADDYSINIGEELFGTDREAFTRTAWISGRDMSFSMNDNLYSALGNLNETDGSRPDFEGKSGDEEKSGHEDETGETGMQRARSAFGSESERFERAVLKLSDERRQYEKNGQRGRVYELVADISKIDEVCAEKQKQMKETENSIALLAGRSGGGLKNFKHASGSGEEESARLEEAIKKEGKYIKRARVVWICALSAAAAAAGFSAGYFKGAAGGATGTAAAAVLFLLIGAACAAADLFYSVKRKQNKIKLKETSRRMSEINDYKKIADDRLLQRKNQLEREKQELAQEIITLKTKRGGLVKELEESRKKSELLKKTIQYLKEARALCADAYTDTVSERFLEYAGRLDGELASEIKLNSEFDIKYEKGASLWELDYMSCGQKDMLWFCERLAVADRVYSDKDVFLVLDEPFVNLDDKHMAEARGLVRECAEKRQVFYFTCRHANLC